jgi:hypothetical protein
MVENNIINMQIHMLYICELFTKGLPTPTPTSTYIIYIYVYENYLYSQNNDDTRNLTFGRVCD